VRYDILAIVASVRGVAPMRRLLERLPASFDVPVVCFAECHEALASELAAETGRDVRFARAGERLEPGRVYLSPPGCTPLLVEDRAITLAPYGPESTALHPQDNFLASVSAQFGARALCVVLGNFESDGVHGARAIRERGGTVLVLDRATAMHWGMAEPIVRAGACDRVLGAEEVGDALRAWFTPCDILESAELQFQLGELLDRALRLSGTRLGHVQLLERPRSVLRVIAYRGFEKRLLDRFDAMDASGEAACSRALRYRQRVVIDDVEADVQYRPYLDMARGSGYRAVQSTPLFTLQARLGGMLTTHFPYAHRLEAHEAGMLDEIARSAQPLVSRFQGDEGT
jgi:hypothetical protein